MSLSFAEPAAFWLLLLIPLLLGVRIAADLRATQVVSRIAAPRLIPQLLAWHARGRSWFAFGMELLGIALMVAALARPQWGIIEEESGGSGRSLIIGIDTSRSMLANDLQPDRLTRAKLAAIDLVKKLRGDRIGLMPFAGNAFMYAPITPDIDALIDSIDSLDAEIIPRGGSNLARAVDKAIDTFARSDLSGQQVLILFSDGEELEGEALAAAKRARDARVALVCVAVGTQNGGVIPDPDAPGGYFRDRSGKIVYSRLQRDVLMKMATLTGGLYLPLDGKGVNDARIEAILKNLQRSAMKGKVTRKAVDRYQWPLAAGLFALAAAYLLGIVARHRARAANSLASTATAAACLACCFLLASPAGAADAEPPPPAPADPVVGDPWKFYREGDFANAQFNFERLLAEGGSEQSSARRGLGVVVDRFLGSDRAAATTPERLQFARGAAALKAADYEAAMDAFGSVLATPEPALRERAHYNLAAAIYEQAKAQNKRVKKPTLKYLDNVIRRLENAVEHYLDALVLNPDNAAARRNHDLVADLIRKLRQKREEMAQQQGQGQGEGKQKGKQKGRQKGEGQGQGQGQGQGEGQGEGQGQGQGQGRQPGEQGENGEDEGEGEGDDGEEGEGEGGEEEGENGSGGEKKGEAEKGREESNAEREGNIGTQSGGKQPGGENGEPSDEESDDDAVNSATGYSRAEAMDQLRQLSDEDMTVRPRIETSRESRPAKDW